MDRCRSASGHEMGRYRPIFPLLGREAVLGTRPQNSCVGRPARATPGGPSFCLPRAPLPKVVPCYCAHAVMGLYPGCDGPCRNHRTRLSARGTERIARGNPPQAGRRGLFQRPCPSWRAPDPPGPRQAAQPEACTREQLIGGASCRPDHKRDKSAVGPRPNGTNLTYVNWHLWWTRIPSRKCAAASPSFAAWPA